MPVVDTVTDYFLCDYRQYRSEVENVREKE